MEKTLNSEEYNLSINKKYFIKKLLTDQSQCSFFRERKNRII